MHSDSIPIKKRQEYQFIPDVFYWRYRARNTGQKCCFLILQQASFMYSRIKMYKNFHLRTYRFSCGDRNRLRTLTRFPIFQHTKMSWYTKLIKHTTDTFPYSNIQQSTFPHQPKAGGSPFLSRTGNALCSFHLDANAFLRSVTLISSTILSYTPTLWNQRSTRQTAEAVYRQLFYAIPRRIVNR